MTPPGDRRWRLARVGALAGLYFVTARLGLSLGAVAGVATAVWPPTGISLAALLLHGNTLWPGVALGAFAANLSIGVPWWGAAAIATGNTLEALVGVALLSRVRGFRTTLDALAGVLGLILLAATASTAVSATIGVASSWAAGVVPSSALWKAWWTWWLGDMLGNLVVAPCLLSWASAGRSVRERSGFEGGALALATMGTSGLVFAGMGRAGEGGPFEAYLLFPFLIAAAVRFGPRGASGSMAAVSLVAIAGTAQGLGPFAREDLTGSLLALQMFLGVAAVTSLILAAVAAERDRAERVARMLTDTLERRVAERTSELSRANRELEAFGYSVAHDLRAPLRSIDGFCHRLVERLGPGLEPDTRSYLEKVSSASRRMARLVEGLLQFSLLSRADPRREEVDLSAIAIRAGQELARSQPDRRVLFLIEPGLRARGDPTLLGVMLWNLLENGFKFTAGRPEGRVEFGACPGKGPRTLFVRDDGVGFDMAHAPKLFKPFQRLHGRDEFPGSGIGLEMVQRIVDRHGGRVWAEARTGVGATFYFTLPGEP